MRFAHRFFVRSVSEAMAHAELHSSRVLPACRGEAAAIAGAAQRVLRIGLIVRLREDQIDIGALRQVMVVAERNQRDVAVREQCILCVTDRTHQVPGAHGVTHAERIAFRVQPRVRVDGRADHGVDREEGSRAEIRG